MNERRESYAQKLSEGMGTEMLRKTVVQFGKLEAGGQWRAGGGGGNGPGA